MGNKKADVFVIALEILGALSALAVFGLAVWSATDGVLEALQIQLAGESELGPMAFGIVFVLILVAGGSLVAMYGSGLWGMLKHSHQSLRRWAEGRTENNSGND